MVQYLLHFFLFFYVSLALCIFTFLSRKQCKKKNIKQCNEFRLHNACSVSSCNWQCFSSNFSSLISYYPSSPYGLQPSKWLFLEAVQNHIHRTFDTEIFSFCRIYLYSNLELIFNEPNLADIQIQFIYWFFCLNREMVGKLNIFKNKKKSP